MENPGGRNVNTERPAEPVEKPEVSIAEKYRGGVVGLAITSSSKEAAEEAAKKYLDIDYPWAGYSTSFRPAHQTDDGSWCISGMRNSKC